MNYVILGTFQPPRTLAICDNMFYGFFQTEQPGPIPSGELKDSGGASVIDEVKFDFNRLEFIQVRENSDEKIRYKLECNGNVWTGTYQGEKTRLGYVRCVINRVDLNFFT